MTDRSSREIERDLERRRNDLRGTIDEALDRMTLEGALNYAGQYLRDHRSSYGQTVGTVLKEKPLAVGLVAIGMAWIMFGPSTADRRPSSEDRYRQDDDWRDDAEPRRRIAAGDFGETSARGPIGPDAWPDPWTKPSRSSSSVPPRSGAGSEALGAASSPAKSTPVAPSATTSGSAGVPGRSSLASSNTGTSSRSSALDGTTGSSEVAAPAVAPTSSPVRTEGTASSASKPASGIRSGQSEISVHASTTGPNSSKV